MKRTGNLSDALMNEWNIGVDIVDVARFRQLEYSSCKQFYERTFTTKEIEHCLSFKDPAPHFAANFAAKEAVYKAISRFHDYNLNQVEVLDDMDGAPYVNLRHNHKIAKNMSSKGYLPFDIRVSLSHSALNAIAFAVVTCTRRIVENVWFPNENSVP